MSAQKGKELLLQVDDGASGYETIGGFTSNEFSINGNAVDATTKDSAGFKEMLDGGGLVSIRTGGNGIFVSGDGYATVHDAVLAGTHLDCRIVMPGFMNYTGPFIVTTLSVSGGTEDAITYDISLDSAGPITATPV